MAICEGDYVIVKSNLRDLDLSGTNYRRIKEDHLDVGIPYLVHRISPGSNNIHILGKMNWHPMKIFIKSQPEEQTIDFNFEIIFE